MDPDTLQLAEIFVSLQGESTFAGLPCAFARLAGCSLRCRWCDTPEAQGAGAPVARREVLSRLLALDVPLVEVTGGEPLEQPGTVVLLRELCDAGRTVLLETNGAHDLSVVDPRVHRIVDLKAPSSGAQPRNRLENLALLSARDELKFVLASRADYEWMRELVRAQQLEARPVALLASCVWGELAPTELAQWLLADRLRVRLQIQLHKLLWGPNARGV